MAKLRNSKAVEKGLGVKTLEILDIGTAEH